MNLDQAALMIITSASQKGGVTKSSAALALASLFALRYRVAFLDLDKEAFATTMGLAQRVAADPLHDEPVRVSIGAPSAGELLLFAGSGAIGGADEEALARHIVRASQMADVVVIDTPPDGSSPAVLAALRAATVVVVPVTPEFDAMTGMQRLLATASRLGVVAPVRTLLSRWDARTRLAQDVHQLIVARNPGITLSAIVPRDQKAAEATAAGCPVPFYAKRSAAATAFRTATYEIAALTGLSIPQGAL
jgi:chromosome partitioning protein